MNEFKGIFISDDLLKENEERWKNKSFYKPKKNWRKVWEENHI